MTEGHHRRPKKIFFNILTAVALFLALALNISCQSRDGDGQQSPPADSPQSDQKRTEGKKEAFLASIGETYLRAQSLLEAGDLEKAYAEAEKFQLYNKLDYEDAGELYRKIKIAKLQKDVKALPAEYPAENLEIYRQLQEMVPENESYGKKVAFYTQKLQEEQKKIAGSDLEVVEWVTYKTKYGDFIKAEGKVRNVSKRELKRITAVVAWHDGKGKEILAESAVLANPALPPGEISPFTVIADYKPEMKRAAVGFKHILGEKIAAYIRLNDLRILDEPPAAESAPEE